MDEGAVSFSWQFNHAIPQTRQGVGPAYFGSDVLSGLVQGIDQYRRELPGKSLVRSLGPAVLGAFLWLDDDELINAVAQYSAGCVVVSKQQEKAGKRRENKQRTFERLRQLGEQKGLYSQAFPELSDLAPEENGRPLVVGPWTELPDVAIPMFRSIGFRRVGDQLVPILHTKLVLLGNLWWHDEGPLGDVTDVFGFAPERLWVGSANGTRSSRSNLEMGVWLNDPQLLNAARRFLTAVIRHSEDIDSTNDVLEPEFASFEFDDEAMAEASALWAEAYADETLELD